MAKILINLLSEQTVQNYIAIKELAPEKVIALVTDKYLQQVDMFADITSVPHETIEVKPFLMQETITLLGAYLKDMSSEDEIILNFTGGTKIMALASVFAAMNLQATVIKLLYVNTSKNCCEHYLWQNANMKPPQIEPFKDDIKFDLFVKLAGESIKSVGINDISDIANRLTMTEWIFNQRANVGQCYGECFEQVGARRKVCNSKILQVKDGSREVAEIQWQADNLAVSPKDKKAFAVKMNEPGGYIAGGWLEELCFAKLHDSGLFDQVLGSVVIDLSETTKMSRSLHGYQAGDKNELDVVVTKGVNATLIECKAGKLAQEHLYKLYALTEYLCGTYGKAFLVTAYPRRKLEKAYPEFLEKARDMGITIVAGDDISNIAAITAKKMTQ
jgi:hypothetical protein